MKEFSRIEYHKPKNLQFFIKKKGANILPGFSIIKKNLTSSTPISEQGT